MSLPSRQPGPPAPASVLLPAHRRSRSHQGHIVGSFTPYSSSPSSAFDRSAGADYPDHVQYGVQGLPTGSHIRRISSPLGQYRLSSQSPPGTASSSSAPCRLPPMPAPLNLDCEHWLVTSKEAARRMDDLSVLDKSLLTSVVTFEPESYRTVTGSSPGQNAWFKAQQCTCDTYKGGFQKVRRPATVREHLSKQPCAPPALARMADLQLRLLRSASRRPSNVSASSSGSSPRFAALPDFEPVQAGPSPSFDAPQYGVKLEHDPHGEPIRHGQPVFFSPPPPSHAPEMAYSWPPASSSWPSAASSLDSRAVHDYHAGPHLMHTSQGYKLTHTPWPSMLAHDSLAHQPQHPTQQSEASRMLQDGHYTPAQPDSQAYDYREWLQ